MRPASRASPPGTTPTTEIVTQPEESTMVVTSDGGGSSQAGQQISVTIAKIEEIAKSVVAHAEQDASSSHQGFQDTPVSLTAYGDVPLAQGIGEMHQAAHLIFLDTVKGVVEDLKTFQANLLDSARAHQGTDDAAYATLTSLGRKYEDHKYHSDTNWQSSSRKHWHGGDEGGTKSHMGDDGDHGSKEKPKGSGDRGY